MVRVWGEASVIGEAALPLEAVDHARHGGDKKTKSKHGKKTKMKHGDGEGSKRFEPY